MAQKILLVDDDPSIVQLFRMILEMAGYAVEDCSSGREVRNKVRQLKPDLLILDVMLPGMDGYAITKSLAEDADTKRVPIIVITTLAQTQTMFKGNPQVTGFIGKPVKEDELLAKVKDALSQNGS